MEINFFRKQSDNSQEFSRRVVNSMSPYDNAQIYTEWGKITLKQYINGNRIW